MRKVLLPLATSLLFSGSYIAGKYTTLELEPLTTTLARYVVALAFLVALLPRYRLAGLRIERRHLPALVALGLTGIVGYHYFFFLSLRYTAVANTAIINALSPVVTGLAAAAVLGERLTGSNYAGVSLACAGVVLLLSGAQPARWLALDLNAGDLLMLLSVLCWTAYALLVKRLIARYSGYALTFYATLFGVVLLLVLTPGEAPLDQLAGASPAAVLSVLYMGLFASGLGYLLYNLSIEAIGPTRTSSFVYSAVAVCVAGLAWLFFAQPVTAVMVASTGLVLAGLRLVLAE